MSDADPASDPKTDPWYRTEQGERNRITFHSSPRSSLGMELELQVLDPETGGLAHGARLVHEEAGSLQAVVGSLCAELRDDDVLTSI